MRYSAAPLIVSLPFFLFSSVAAREPVQFRIARRATAPTFDTCAALDMPVTDIISMAMDGDSASATVGGKRDVNQCLCSADASSALSSSGMSSDINKDDATHTLTTYIAKSSTAQNCVYPPGAVPQCTIDDVCAFTCEEGFQSATITQDGNPVKTCQVQRNNFNKAFATPTFERAQASPSLRARAAPSPVNVLRARASPSLQVNAVKAVQTAPVLRARASPSLQVNAIKAVQTTPALRARASPSLQVNAIKAVPTTPSLRARASPSLQVNAVKAVETTPVLRARAAPSPSVAFQNNRAKAAPTGTPDSSSSSNSLYSAFAQEAQDAGCAPQEMLCGAYAPRGRSTTECVNVQNSLESCGGCMSSFMSAVSNAAAAPMGVDCSAIEGVMDVGCKMGKCVVQSCDDGYVIAPSGNSCVSAAKFNRANAQAVSASPSSGVSFSNAISGVNTGMTLNDEDAAGGSGVNDVPATMPRPGTANLSLDEANVVPTGTISYSVNMPTASIGDVSGEVSSFVSGLTSTLSLSTPAVPTATLSVADSDSIGAGAGADSDA